MAENLSQKFNHCPRVIKGTEILVKIKSMQFKDKDQTGKTDAHNKEHQIIKIINTKK